MNGCSLYSVAADGIGQAIAAGSRRARNRRQSLLGDIDEMELVQASDLIGATAHPAAPVTPDVQAIRPSIERPARPDFACRRLARARWTGSAHGDDGRRADSGLGGFHVDVASAKSFYSDMLGWETDDQPMGAFTYTVMRSAGAGDEQRSERHHAAQLEMAAARATPRWASRSPTARLRQPRGEAVSDLVKGISCDPLRASGFDSCG